LMLMPQLAAAAGLRPNERPVQLWRAGLEMSYVGMDDEDLNHTLNGLLLATDQRLIYIQEKWLFGKSYRPCESIEYGQIAKWNVHRFMRVKNLVVDMSVGRDRRKSFQNLYEVDPFTLNALAPWPAEQAQALLHNLIEGRN